MEHQKTNQLTEGGSEYHFVLIDEAVTFEAIWTSLLVKIVCPQDKITSFDLNKEVKNRKYVCVFDFFGFFALFNKKKILLPLKLIVK